MKHMVRKPLMWVADKVMPRRVGHRVICMHEIGCRECFEERLVWLLKNYYVVPMTTQLESAEFNEGPRLNWTSVTLTFDDGHMSWFKNVIPVLSEYEVSAIFFVNEYRLDVNLFQVHPFHYLWTVGGHVRGHWNVSQIVKRQTLNKRIEPLEHFAYPFGMMKHINPTVVRYLHDNRFVKYAFTSVPGFVTPTTNPLLIPRDSLSLSDPTWYWRSRLNGNYDYLYRRLHGSI